MHSPVLHEEGSGKRQSPVEDEVRDHLDPVLSLLHEPVPEASTHRITQLNPVIGETLQGSYADGTQVYCEQISHHPPISYFLIIGPQDSYRYIGYYAFEANAGLNSMTLTNKGRRWFQFSDGTRIDVNFNKETFAGVFMGSLRSEAIGSFTIKDAKNQL